MDPTNKGTWPTPDQSRGVAANSPFAAMVVLFVLGGLIFAVLFPPIEGSETGVPVSRKISTDNYPATVIQTIGQPIGEEWILPTAAVRLGEIVYVLDTGNNRILALDERGRLNSVLGSADSERLPLSQPMSMTTDGERLLVANSLMGEIVIVDPQRALVENIEIPLQPGDRQPRPIGVAAGSDGEIVVSDAENHRVLILDADGGVKATFGIGTRVGGSTGLNVPGWVTLDSQGNIYVVDTLNGRVVKLSSDGEFIRDFAHLADTAGSLARPKAVAVDREGRIFVSDGLQAAIEVFAPEGDYLGVIGRRDPADASVGSIFEAPSGLFLSGDRLLVVDAVLGLIEFRLENGDSLETGG